MSEEEKPMSEARQFTILVERVEHQLKGVAEGHQALSTEMKEMKEELIKKMDEEFKITNTSVRLLAEDLKGTNQRIDRVGKNLGDVEKNLGDKIDGLGQRLVTVEAR